MSILKNFTYNSILTVSNYFFPLITFPYVSRVIGVENIGICNFIDGIINYFILFSMLGLTATGIREVAKVKEDPEALSETFSSLFVLNSIFTLISIVALICATIFIPKLTDNYDLMILGAVKLIFNLFLVEWLFKGLENFKFITLRSVIVKLIFVIAIFLFVKERDDFNIYYGLLVGMVVLNSIINWRYRKIQVRLSFKRIELKRHLRSFTVIGLYLILTSMYTSFNVIYLGFVAGNEEVGFYTTAVKIYTILLSLFTAFTAVMLPRMSALVAEGKYDKLKLAVGKSFELLMIFSIPIIILMSIFSDEIIHLFAGPGFEGAVLPMKIVLPLILIIGFEQILVVQILIPFKMDKSVLLNSVIGALIGIALNIVLVPHLKSVGSALVWLSSELFVFAASLYIVIKRVQIKFPLLKLAWALTYSLPVLFISLFILLFTNFDDLTKLIFAIVLSVLYLLIFHIVIMKKRMLTAFSVMTKDL